jgi:hypothetical protein
MYLERPQASKANLKFDYYRMRRLDIEKALRSIADAQWLLEVSQFAEPANLSHHRTLHTSLETFELVCPRSIDCQFERRYLSMEKPSLVFKDTIRINPLADSSYANRVAASMTNPLNPSIPGHQCCQQSSTPNTLAPLVMWSTVGTSSHRLQWLLILSSSPSAVRTNP